MRTRPARSARHRLPVGAALVALALIVAACSGPSGDEATTGGSSGSTAPTGTIAPGTAPGSTAPSSGEVTTSAPDVATTSRPGAVTTPPPASTATTTATAPTSPTTTPTSPTTGPLPDTGTLAGTAYFGVDCDLVTHDGCAPVTDYVVVTGGTIETGLQVATDATGHFSVQLPPGTYQWKPRWMAHYVCNEVPTVVLTAGATSDTTVWCTWEG